MGLRQEVVWGSGSLSKGWDEKSFFALFDKIEQINYHKFQPIKEVEDG